MAIPQDMPIREKPTAAEPEVEQTETFTLSSEDRERLYEPLAGEQIRLLKIHPAETMEADIVCDLVIEDIALEPGTVPDEETGILEGIAQYDALSYCWGSPALTDTIQCNGTRLPVIGTLLEALRHIRLSDKPRLLWTDLCCINQEDLEEKSKQVQMMFVIFQRALKVVAWIGPPTDDDMLVCTLVEMVDEYDRIDGAMHQLGMPMRPEYLLGPGEKDPHAERARKSAQTFITSRPFFQRTWIRQEVFAARKLNVICGSYVYSFKRFTNVLDQILPDQTTGSSKFVNSDDPTARALLCYSYFRMDHDKFYNISSINLHTVLFHTVLRSAMYQSTLPQDKVYGVLGMMSEQTKMADNPYEPNEEDDITNGFPAPDYNKPVSLVYQDFVKHHMNKSRTLNCLSIFHKRALQGTDLPSWAVDLRVDTPRYLVPGQLADWGIIYEDQIPEQSFDNHGSLELRGVHIGEIGEQVGPDPWAAGYPRAAMGSPSPMLLSCVDADEQWFPDEEDEHGGGRDGNRLLDITLQRLERSCGYTWKAVGKRSAPLGSTETYRWPGKEFHSHAFVSNLVREGDAIVHLGGAELAYVLRRPEDNAEGWKFLGPAFLTVGVFNKKEIMDGRAVFNHEMAHIIDDEFEWEEKAEDFVLV
jgi:hypothetical protein